MHKLITFFKNWALPISMATGVILYVIYHFSPALYPIGPVCKVICEKGQPIMIAAMLFLQFNKVPPSMIKPRKWHLWLLIFQGSIFTAMGLVIMRMPETDWRILLETFMAAIMCPTATASGVITDKLGGDLAGNISYLLMINVLYCLLFPLVIPLIHPVEGLTFMACFLRLAGHIVPPLMLPCVVAWIIRYTCPRLQKWLAEYTNLAFWIWVVSLSICFVLATRIIILCHMTVLTLLLIAVVTGIACALQFSFGRFVGSRNSKRDGLTAGQSLGQKNTGFMIWTAYSFMTPQTAVGGGFYSLWHNIVNSIELARKRKADEAARQSATSGR